MASNTGSVVPLKIIVEWPRTYGGRASRGDANDLFALAGIGAALTVINPWAIIESFCPSEWKGSVKKPKSTKQPYMVELRVRDRLAPGELARVEWPRNIQHTWDVTDAIGIGLKFHGRYELRRVHAAE